MVILKIRKDFTMNLNILAIVYLTFAVIAVGVAVVIFLDQRPPREDH